MKHDIIHIEDLSPVHHIKHDIIHIEDLSPFNPLKHDIIHGKDLSPVHPYIPYYHIISDIFDLLYNKIKCHYDLPFEKGVGLHFNNPLQPWMLCAKISRNRPIGFVIR